MSRHTCAPHCDRCYRLALARVMTINAVRKLHLQSWRARVMLIDVRSEVGLAFTEREVNKALQWHRKAGRIQYNNASGWAPR